MLVQKVTYFKAFGYLNSSCIRKSIILVFLSSSSDTCWCHVGAHLDEHQHGVSIQISINLGKKCLHISRLRKIALINLKLSEIR